MKWRFFRLITFLCLAGILAMAAAGHWFWTNPLPPAASRAKIAWSPPASGGGLARPSGLADNLSGIALQRPIFSPARRPFVAPPALPAADPVPDQPPPQQIAPEPMVEEASLPPPQFTLRGILISPGKSSAFLSTVELPAGQWLMVGDDIAGWTIKSIENNAVTLTRGVQSTAVELYVDNSQNGLGLTRPTR